MPPSRNAKSRTRSPSTSTAGGLKRRAHLSPQTLSVSSNRVLKTWRPLPTPTQDRIRTLLLAIQSQTQSARRSSKASGRNGKGPSNPNKLDLTDDDYDEMVQALVSKLVVRLPKMTFPAARSKANSAAAAAAHDLDFDYEATLHRTAVLSAQLSEATQSSKLLRASIRKEEQNLRAEKAELDALAENLKRGTQAQRTQEKRLHPLARQLGGGRSAKVEDGEEGVADQMLGTARRRHVVEAPLGKAEIEGDADLEDLMKQLGSHLGSMATNTASLQGMRRELGRAEVAIRAFAWQRLGRDKYLRVMDVQ
ncbi:uncharacterized protein HMPREF1541_08302 [Cyphellophora europaea CBS 101466]|uniref:Kinetochore protein Fta7 n=1 Tax=Cyphellophora europaea (strain CBS 101466) TaxID=1220924 RepID=W2RLE1_CYPE1|nr:uncharacterized protein HMPREF1541_08302 [Cyphellophora europaea CBS 101466]ETN37311.1 hypothetical protein HMPREF1541_08302 [Cyphellophora europaea CBS 101466]